MCVFADLVLFQNTFNHEFLRSSMSAEENVADIKFKDNLGEEKIERKRNAQKMCNVAQFFVHFS